MELNNISQEVIGAAIEVHRVLGPGLLESTYEACLAHELQCRTIRYARQVVLPVLYKGVTLDCGYKLDLLIEEQVVIELKAVELVLPIHRAQLLTYLKLTGCKLGLIINFNVPMLHKGIERVVNRL